MQALLETEWDKFVSSGPPGNLVKLFILSGFKLLIGLAHVWFMLHKNYFPVILSSVTTVLNKLIPQSHLCYVNISSFLLFFLSGIPPKGNAVHLQPYALQKKKIT